MGGLIHGFAIFGSMKYNRWMHRSRKLLFLGIWIAVLPYLGFPSGWKSILFSLTGLGIMYFSYVLYSEQKESEVNIKTFENFSENYNYEDKKTLN
jgi:hypothetical protein